MTVRIDEHGCLIVGNCALPAAVVPAVEAFYREKFARAGVVAEEPEWETEQRTNWGSGRVFERKVTPWAPVKQEGAGIDG